MQIIIYSNYLCISNPEDITIIVYKVHIYLDLSTYLASWLIFSSSCILLILDCGKKKSVCPIWKKIRLDVDLI